MHRSKIWISFIAFISASLVLLNVSIFELNLGYTYYSWFALILPFLLVSGKRPKLSKVLIVILIISVLSIQLNIIPNSFRPWERFFAFILMLLILSPLIENSRLKQFRLLTFNYLNILLILSILISFVGLVIQNSIVYSGRGGFNGFYTHSMILSPFAGISIIYSLNEGFNSTKKNKRSLYFVISIIGFIVCLAAGSRTALISLAVAFIFYFYKRYQNNIGKSIRIVLFVFVAGVISFPYWEKYTERVTGKIEYSEEKGDFAITRLHLWNNRISEISSSPFFGVGFAHDSTLSVVELNKRGGQIEPGSSWLVVFSMIGVFGFILFSLLIINSFIIPNLLNYNSYYFPFLSSTLIFFMIHLLAEGYVLSAGSCLFFYFWLLIGVINIVKTENTTH